jgi:hypothetical protein
MRTLLKAILTVAVVGGFLAGASRAEAAFKIRISDGGFTAAIDIEDNVSVLDTSNLAGEIATAAFTFGDFRVTTWASLSKPQTGTAAFPDMDLNFLVRRLTNNTAATTLSLIATDTDFTTSPMDLVINFGGTNAPGASVVANSYFDNSNTEFAETGGPATNGPHGPGGGYSSSSILSVTGATPYSLTMRVDLSDLTAGGSGSSGDLHLLGTPLPGGVILALTGIPALGVGAWIRRRKSTVAA